MGYFRFRRSIKILPGVRWNIGKTGSSVSFGGRGFTHAIGPKGSRTTISIPGTGISYTQTHPHQQPMPPAPSPPSQTPPNVPSKRSLSRAFYAVGIVLLVLWLLTKAAQQGQPSNTAQTVTITPPPSVAPASTATPYQYTARATSSPSVTFPPYPWSSASPTTTPVPVRRAVPVLETLTTTVPPTAVPALQPALTMTPEPSRMAQAYTSTYRLLNVLPGDTLNVRSGPGANFPIAFKLRPDTRGIFVLGASRLVNGSTVWQKIVVGKNTGWVNEVYLEVEPSRR